VQLNSCASDIYRLIIYLILILNQVLTPFAARMPTERVSILLLGHNNLIVSENHYSPWVRARQKQVEADVGRSWESQSQRQSA